ncbi:hypothetical protein Enr17x_03780 [Gimesia fumaroli]|uniref:Uncharacterized protein n=1 Tax=Gimesia fumaroli TaxID=2527976 RepID=A0A518I5J0_9PLAN|nr:hypothetical protein Enr17x_03780 [Gimesia fumaroli]
MFCYNNLIVDPQEFLNLTGCLSIYVRKAMKAVRYDINDTWVPIEIRLYWR